LNGVSAARRKLLPPAASNTSRGRAVPACAPSATPSAAREFGTQTIVDAE
jgi:hypothetical protein